MKAAKDNAPPSPPAKAEPSKPTPRVTVKATRSRSDPEWTDSGGQLFADRIHTNPLTTDEESSSFEFAIGRDELADLAANGRGISVLVMDEEDFGSDDDEPREIERCPL